MVNSNHLEQRLNNFTENMVRWRKQMGWTQDDLAQRMSGAGLKFYPQTVQKIETGDRRIQLGEAIEIARILGVSLGSMLASPRDNIIESRQAEAEAAGLDITSAALEYLNEQIMLAQLLDDTAAGGHDLPDWVVETLDNTLEDRLDVARRQYIAGMEDSADDFGLEPTPFSEQVAKSGVHTRQAAESLGLVAWDGDDE